jgi:hypothetical protein
MMLAAVFVLVGAAFLFYPRLLLRLYARTALSARYPLQDSNEKLLYCRAYGLVFIAFGVYLVWG